MTRALYAVAALAIAAAAAELAAWLTALWWSYRIRDWSQWWLDHTEETT